LLSHEHDPYLIFFELTLDARVAEKNLISKKELLEKNVSSFQDFYILLNSIICTSPSNYSPTYEQIFLWQYPSINLYHWFGKLPKQCMMKII